MKLFSNFAATEVLLLANRPFLFGAPHGLLEATGRDTNCVDELYKTA